MLYCIATPDVFCMGRTGDSSPSEIFNSGRHGMYHVWLLASIILSQYAGIALVVSLATTAPQFSVLVLGLVLQGPEMGAWILTVICVGIYFWMQSLMRIGSKFIISATTIMFVAACFLVVRYTILS